MSIIPCPSWSPNISCPSTHRAKHLRSQCYLQGRSQPSRCGGAEQHFLPKIDVRFWKWQEIFKYHIRDIFVKIGRFFLIYGNSSEHFWNCMKIFWILWIFRKFVHFYEILRHFRTFWEILGNFVTVCTTCPTAGYDIKLNQKMNIYVCTDILRNKDALFKAK